MHGKIALLGLGLGLVGASLVAPPATAAGSPATGAWTAPFTPAGPTSRVIGVHSVQLYTGKVLVFGPAAGTPAYVYDPQTGTTIEADPPANVECAAVVPLADGRILLVGGIALGNVGINNVLLFDPLDLTWTPQPQTPLGRYYPVATRLADGRVVISGGETATGTNNVTVEVYTPPPVGSRVGTLARVADHPSTIYPRQFLMPDGKVLEITSTRTSLLNPATWAWTPLPAPLHPGQTVTLLPGSAAGSTKVLMAGAGEETFDYATPTVGWKVAAALPQIRWHMAATWTPDGRLIGVGGNSVANNFAGTSYYSALSYDPAANSWTTLASQTARRDYHSTAVLLPDGRVWSAGDTGTGGGGNRDTIFSPPYLFGGVRPTITSAPTHVASGMPFTVQTPSVGKLVLMSPGASTHTSDMNGRYITLAQSPAAGSITATAPAPNVAPSGWYMLFLVDANDAPSVASWVHLD